MALDVSIASSICSLRNVAAATASLDELEALATRHGFPLIQAHGLGLRGWLMVQQGGDASTAD